MSAFLGGAVALTMSAAPSLAKNRDDEQTGKMKHHSKAKGAIVGGAGGAVVGGKKGAAAGAAGGALWQHHKNKKQAKTGEAQ